MLTFKDPYIDATVDELDCILYGSDRLHNEPEEQEKLSKMLDRWRTRLGVICSAHESEEESTEKPEPLSEVYVKYIANNKTVHELACGLAYYNYQGNHFRVFRDMFDALLFTDGAHIHSLVDFTSESEMDTWILWYINKSKETK